MDEKRFVGIDISQDQLDGIALPDQETFAFPNDESGIGQLLENLREPTPTLVVLEATGGLEFPTALALAAANIPVAIINPRQARDFA